MLLTEIQKDVEAIITHSQAYPFQLDASQLIEKWYNNKKRFIDAFGGTIWRSPEPVKLELSNSEKHKKFSSFMDEIDRLNLLTCDNEDISFEQFLTQNEEGFFENKTITDCGGVPTGRKLLKSFKTFISDTGSLRWAQDTASKYIQESKVEGYLYLSVDPRDFLTISENAANWNSCHSLDRDYRAGNLSYMVDKVTVIAYLASDEKVHFPCLPKDMIWYNKKWRMLIYNNFEENIYYSRQYPFQSAILFNIADKAFLKVMQMEDKFDNFYPLPTFSHVKTRGYNAPFFLNNNYVIINGEPVNTKDFVNKNDYLGYCDITSSAVYIPQVKLGIKNWWFASNKAFNIKIGESAPCPCCGKDILDITYSLLCIDCREKYDVEDDLFCSCSNCGRRIYGEPKQAEWSDEEGYLCAKCYEELKREKELEDGKRECC